MSGLLIIDECADIDREQLEAVFAIPRRLAPSRAVVHMNHRAAMSHALSEAIVLGRTALLAELAETNDAWADVEIDVELPALPPARSAAHPNRKAARTAAAIARRRRTR